MSNRFFFQTTKGIFTMSRQIQLRRGSAAAHQSFIGAVGEVTVDTTNNTLHVHDGITPGGHETCGAGWVTLPEYMDFVIDAWRSDDGVSWYRKYKSGWIEQGGITNYPNVKFPVSFMNINYTVTAIAEMIDGGVGTISICYANKQMTSVDLQIRWNGGARDNASRIWFAQGF